MSDAVRLVNVRENDAAEIDRLKKITGLTRYTLIHKCIEAFKKMNKIPDEGTKK